MVYGWQLWLSPRPSRRTDTPRESRMLSPNDAALYEFLYDEDGRYAVRETHYADNKAVRDGISGPPLHIHIRQTEYFQVQQGALAVVKNGKESVITKNDGILVIAPGARHRFWAHSPVREDLVFKVWAEPQDLGHAFDESFLRNSLGYLRDCQQQGIEPSVFQMALLGWSSDTIFVTPSFWVPIWILKLAQYVIGHFIGGLLLGYKATYPEYSITTQDDSNKKKKK
ncbi:uncharacterized protein F4812DRAFT_417335 [Daldinia caldariorum]|uniref:uncharacterized protein n=1 Tax=Daldinia caldariorum TaxID=326644 RepID=UPI002008721D|nr:uncharacterized protein F4812DRAFT_417335 [Daldinia caldariorum]KAI1470388.1 hypothetical protein F4812DRAFT_417335 [Daldinia caldariorum]